MLGRRVGDLSFAPSKQMVAFTPLTSAADALHAFCEHNIRSAPVLDGEKVLGFVDHRDFVAAVLSHLKQHKLLVSLPREFSPESSF
jgi:CBS domain-containing protein